MVNGVIYGLFAFFVLIGFLLGLRRGLFKSLIRFVSVLICAIIVVFVVPSLSKTILEIDISSAGVEVGGSVATTIGGAILSLVSSIEVVGELMNASPTLSAVISSIPVILINLILFIVFFFLLKGIFYFIDIILNKIILRKADSNKKRRLAGAFIGALQGLLVFLFVLIPIAGSMNILNASLDKMNEASVETAIVAESNESEENDPTDMLNQYNKNFLIKAFNAIGYKAATNSIYDRLTVIEIDEQTETTLSTEVQNLTQIYVDFSKVQEVNIRDLKESDVVNINTLIEDAFKSPIIGNVTTELVRAVANAWTGSNQEAFLTVAKPELGDALVETFDDLLKYLRTDSKSELENDLSVLVSSLKVVSDYKVIDTVDTGSADAIIYAVGQDGFMEELIGTMAKGKVTKNILPTVMELGLSYAYTGLDIDSTGLQITKTANVVNWDTEKVILGNFFEGVSKTYSSLNAEGEILNKLDFKSFGKALNALRDSELLGPVSQDLTIKLIQCKLLEGVDVSSLVTSLEDEQKYAEMDFEVMFETLKSSVQLANDLKDIMAGTGDVTELNKDDVGTLIDGLTSGGVTTEVLTELATEENLVKSGVDSSTAGAVSGIVSAISNYDSTSGTAVQKPSTDAELESAKNAVEDLMSASTNAKNGTKPYVFSDDEVIAKAKMESFISNMLSSPFIYASTIGEGETLGFKSGNTSSLSKNEQAWLIEVLDGFNDRGEATTTECTQIAYMFGVTY